MKKPLLLDAGWHQQRDSIVSAFAYDRMYTTLCVVIL